LVVQTIRSSDLQILGAALATLGVDFDLIRNFLALCEAGQSSALNCAYMDENIVAAIVGLNKPEPFLSVEPLYRTRRHSCSLLFLSALIALQRVGRHEFRIEIRREISDFLFQGGLRKPPGMPTDGQNAPTLTLLLDG
jgi:hypothetical protein